MGNSTATHRSGTGQYVNSSQHIKIESSSNAGGYGGGSNRYGNNVQITTSRITTDRGELASGGQLTANRA